MSRCDLISRPNMGRTLSTVVPMPNGPSDVWRSSLPFRVQLGEFVKSMKKSQTSWTGREITIVTSIRTIAGLHRFRRPIHCTVAGGEGGPGADGELPRVDAIVRGASTPAVSGACRRRSRLWRARMTASRRDPLVGLEHCKAV